MMWRQNEITGCWEKSQGRGRVICITTTAVVLPDDDGTAWAYIRDDAGRCTWADRKFGSVNAAKRWASRSMQ